MKDYITYTHKIHNKVYSFRLYKHYILEQYNFYLKASMYRNEIPKSIISIVREYFALQIVTKIKEELKNQN